MKNDADELRDELLEEIARCRSCRFCVDVCPTYQISNGLESMSAYGRLQIIKYLLQGQLEVDDGLMYNLYTCLQCKRCEEICRSKGQNLEITRLIHLGFTYLSRNVA